MIAGTGKRIILTVSKNKNLSFIVCGGVSSGIPHFLCMILGLVLLCNPEYSIKRAKNYSSSLVLYDGEGEIFFLYFSFSFQKLSILVKMW